MIIPGGLSVFTHILIIILVYLKKLAEFLMDKMRWEIPKFKMNLYLRTKLASPLSGQAGDSRARRTLAYMIAFTIFVFILTTSIIFIGSRLRSDTNVEFVARNLKTYVAAARQTFGIAETNEAPTPEVTNEKYAATLPLSEVVTLLADQNYPALR